VKILYAAGSNKNARIVLSRFLNAVKTSDKLKNLHLKIAAYQQSSPTNTNIDWTLNSLFDFYYPDKLSLTKNDNLKIYFDQVKHFNPDLIISDLEYFTSNIANILNIPLWQCSSSFLYSSLMRKHFINLYKFHSHISCEDPIKTQGIINLIANAEQNFVYSHFCDLINPPELKPNYHWARPYHQIGKISAPCRHQIVAGLSNADRSLLRMLSQYSSDAIAFAELKEERYQNVVAKTINNEQEYFCNLRNAQFFICQGQANFLSDAFYNRQYALIYPDYEDVDSITNAQLSNYENLGHIMLASENIVDFENQSAYIPVHHPETKYLHEYIEEIT
jgi:uncharacterized protein (TIGR00661 family)